MLISLPLGLATAFARLSSFRPLSGVAHAYVDLFRATPVLVQIFVIAFGIGPALGLKVDVFVLGAFALALNVGAFLSEIFRGAIQSIDRGQREAAISTGMTSRQAMRRVVLPQALRRSVPLVATIWVSLFKDTSLLALVGVGRAVPAGLPGHAATRSGRWKRWPWLHSSTSLSPIPSRSSSSGCSSAIASVTREA